MTKEQTIKAFAVAGALVCGAAATGIAGHFWGENALKYGVVFTVPMGVVIGAATGWRLRDSLVSNKPISNTRAKVLGGIAGAVVGSGGLWSVVFLAGAMLGERAGYALGQSVQAHIARRKPNDAPQP